MTELQTLAQIKLSKIIMGNGSEYRTVRLYNIQDLLHKATLTPQDELVLQHFLNSDRKTIDQTTYVANTAVYPSSWGHTTTVLRKK